MEVRTDIAGDVGKASIGVLLFLLDFGEVHEAEAH